MANNNANVINSAKVIEKVFEYTRTDNNKKSLAMILSVRFKKENKGTKPEESHGFAKYTDMVRKAAKEIGVKAYYTGYIAEYKYDEDGNFVRDEYGDRIKTNRGGWLFEVAGNNPFDKDLCQRAVEFAKEILVKGINAGDFVLAEKKEKAASKKVTKSDLEAQNALLASKLAEALAAIEKLQKAVGK